jgi:hypothetical protein
LLYVIDCTLCGFANRLYAGAVGAHERAGAKTLDIIHIEQLIEVAPNTYYGDSMQQRLLSRRAPAVAHDDTRLCGERLSGHEIRHPKLRSRGHFGTTPSRCHNDWVA